MIVGQCVAETYPWLRYLAANRLCSAETRKMRAFSGRFFNIVDVTQTVLVQSFFGTAGRVMLSTVCIHTRRKSAQW